MLIYTLDLCYYVFSGQHARLYIPTKPDKSAASATVRQLDFQRANVRASLGINTFLARFALDFVKRAIVAQIEADNIGIIRVHVAGDFFSDAYVNMWRDIAVMFSKVAFWTYTKVEKYENAFDDIHNFNVVHSLIKGYGYNFGTCEYIITLYNALVAQGKRKGQLYVLRPCYNTSRYCFRQYLKK